MHSDALDLTAGTKMAFDARPKAPEWKPLLDALFRAGDGLMELRALPSTRRAFFKPGDITGIRKFLTSNADQNCYFGVAARKDSTSGSLENCSVVRVLFVDLDFKALAGGEEEAWQVVADFPLEPTFIIHSGGGLHLYWLLFEAVNLQKEAGNIRSLLRRLARSLKADLAAAEPARVLRLPGTCNLKKEYDTPREVKIASYAERTYSLSDFEFLPCEPEPDRPAIQRTNGNGHHRVHDADERLKRATAYAQALPGAVEGNHGDQETYQTAVWMRDFGLTEDEAFDVLSEHFNPRCVPPWTAEGLREKIRHGYRYAKGPAGSKLEVDRPRPTNKSEQISKATASDPSVPMQTNMPGLIEFGLHDRGNAERIIAAKGGVLRFCHPLRKHLVWDKRRWAIDENGRALHLATLTMVEFVGQAVADGNPELQKFAKSSLNARQLKAALELAQPDLAISPVDLDRDPWLLNCLNGIVDLRTGLLLPHNPAKFITKLIYYDYDPNAIAPTFTAFLNRIMAGNAELIAWLQKALGYSITGITSEKAVFICWGPTNTGKSTLLTAIRSVLKEYSALIQVDTLMMRREESNNSQADLADLRGARFVMTSETESGQRLAVGKLKRITQGQGDIKAVRKYENPITFPETHKLWIDANHKPRIRDTDSSIWNRLHTVPFETAITEPDRKLPGKLAAEGAGILAWLVAGAVRWHAEGLGKPPDEVKAAGENWRQEEDALGDFIEERCVLRADASATYKDLYDAYTGWCKQNDEEHPLGKKRFIGELVERGCNKSRDKYSRRLSGIELRGVFDDKSER